MQNHLTDEAGRRLDVLERRIRRLIQFGATAVVGVAIALIVGANRDDVTKSGRSRENPNPGQRGQDSGLS